MLTYDSWFFQFKMPFEGWQGAFTDIERYTSKIVNLIERTDDVLYSMELNKSELHTFYYRSVFGMWNLIELMGATLSLIVTFLSFFMDPIYRHYFLMYLVTDYYEVEEEPSGEPRHHNITCMQSFSMFWMRLLNRFKCFHLSKCCPSDRLGDLLELQ